jgi:antitoxin ParD1/3/4
MQISLPDLISEFVDKQVRDGGFSDASAYVRELVLRDQKQCAEAQLESLLLEAMESGEPLPWNEEYRESLRNELRERRKSKS